MIGAVAPAPASPIFIHASFRTSSTWLWSRFRANSACYAFYEIFGDTLASMTVEDVPRYRADSWRSNHPDIEPYFLEYLPLLRSAGGVDGYAKEMAVAGYIPRNGLNGAISDAERNYVGKLIECACAKGRIPVLSDTRSLGRMQSLKRIFGGWHIFSYRGIFRQWLSFLDQARGGNKFFIEALLEIIRDNSHDRFFMALERGLNLSSAADCSSQSDAMNAIFQAFFGFHVYLYMNAADCADQIVDVSRLPYDRNYKREMEELLRLKTGLAISFDGAEARAVSPSPLSLDEVEHAVSSFPIWLAEASDHLARFGIVAMAPFGEVLMTDVFDAMRRRGT